MLCLYNVCFSGLSLFTSRFIFQYLLLVGFFFKEKKVFNTSLNKECLFALDFIQLSEQCEL